MADLPEGLEILINSEMAFEGLVMRSPSSILVAEDGYYVVIAPSGKGNLFLAYSRGRTGRKHTVLDFSQEDQLSDALSITVKTGDRNMHYVVHKTNYSLKKHKELNPEIMHLEFQEIPFDEFIARITGAYQSR